MNVRDLNTKHLFTPPKTREDWEKRAAALRRQILVSCGLWPMPTRRPAPKVHVGDSFVQDGLKISNVALETTPGFWMCGTIYAPDRPGRFPAIANSHGHWANGHLTREPDVAKADPKAKTPAPGRADLVSLAANLAKQGFVVFAYDMVGYNDTNQVPHQKFGVDIESWLWGVTELGLQTWNSIRAVDYLCTLPNVDKKRIGATGASGGGTQTFLLAAVDDRVKCSVPVNMVSAIMQGGCTCENAPGLRVNTDNPEIAATFAPKPQLLVNCTGDWTRNVPKEEGPTIRKVYELFGASQNFEVVQFNYQHNYNVESREAMYDFFVRHLGNSSRGAQEVPITLKPEQLRVKRPGGATPEALMTTLRSDSDMHAAQLRKRGGGRSRTLLREGMASCLGITPGKTSPRGKSVLLVSVERDGSVAEWAAALAAQGLAVETLVLPVIQTNKEALWRDYYSTYNQTPLGERVEAILKASGGSAALVGIGDAGLWALLASALAPVPAAAESLSFDESEKTYIERAFAPSWRGLGGVETARWLAAERPLRWEARLASEETAKWLRKALT